MPYELTHDLTQRNQLKSLLVAILALPLLGVNPTSAESPEEDLGNAVDTAVSTVTETVVEVTTDEPSNAPANAHNQSGDEPNWVDSGHGYVTGRMTALTQWVDTAFGDTETDVDQAESRLRLRTTYQEDERFGSDVRVRLGGKVELPRLSKRLNLVFEGDDPQNDINDQSDPSQSRVGLQYDIFNELDSDKHSLGLTMGMSSSGPRPGVKYRYRTNITPADEIRFTQRLQWDNDEETYATSRLLVDHLLNDTQLIRSNTRLFWGEQTQGLEWSTSIAHLAHWKNDSSRERGTMVFTEVSGVTKPYDYISNYKIGFRYRQQTLRDYLFWEVEPSYNWRVDEPFLAREGAWRVELRLEFLLIEELRRDKEAVARR